MSCKSRRVTLNPSPYPDNTMSRRFCQPHMGAIYDAGEEPELRVWNPSNPVTHPLCMCTYVPLGPPEIVDGPTEIDAAGTYTYTIKCGPTPYTCSVDDDRVTLSNLRQKDKSSWDHPKVPEYQIDLNIPEPCDDAFQVTLTVLDKDEEAALITIDIHCGCCNDPEYTRPEIIGDSEVLKPAFYYYEVQQGCPPYVWSLDPEHPTGVELTLASPTVACLRLYETACGSFSISVEDDCERSHELQVRIANQGRWIGHGQVTALQAPWPGSVYLFTMDACPQGPQAWNWRMIMAGRWNTRYDGKYRYRGHDIQIAVGGDEECANYVAENPGLIVVVQNTLSELYRAAMTNPDHQYPDDLCENYTCWFPSSGDFEFIGQDRSVLIFWAPNYYYLEEWVC